MPSVKFELNDADIDYLNDVIKRSSDKAEEKINKYLHDEAPKKVMSSINSIIPVSKRNKRHASESEALESSNINLGFITKTKKQFSYLYFPDQGEGTSKGSNALEFMKKGVEKEYDHILSGVITQLEKTMEE